MMFNIPYVGQCSITTLKSFIQYDVHYSLCCTMQYNNTKKFYSV